MKALLTPIAPLQKRTKTGTGIRRTTVRKSKNGTVPKGFCLELNTKKLGISPRFLTVTHTTLSAKRFRSYGILTIDVTDAEKLG
jgi:hypothetical protein